MRWLAGGSASRPAGIYLDRIGHYLTEAAIPVAIGLRADDWSLSTPGDVGGWTVLGLLVAVIVLVNKAFTDLVVVARAKTGRPLLDDVAQTAASKVSGIAAVRRAAGHLPFFRAFVAVEASLLALAAAVVDAVRGDLLGTQVLVVVMVPLAARSPQPVTSSGCSRARGWTDGADGRAMAWGGRTGRPARCRRPRRAVGAGARARSAAS